MTTPPDTRTFRLVFRGECHPGHDPQAVRQAVVAALKLDDRRAARLFSGRQVVLRRGVDLPSAHRYIVRLAALGAVVHAEPPLSSLLPLPAPAHPTPAREPPAWRRRSVAAAAAGGACVALLLAAGTRPLGLGSEPAAPAPEPPPPVATPAPPAVAPAPPPVMAATAAPPQDTAVLPDDMTPEARRDYLGRYRQAPGHKAFAISSSRHHAWHAGSASPEEARMAALNACVGALRPGDDACRVIDEDGRLQE